MNQQNPVTPPTAPDFAPQVPQGSIPQQPVYFQYPAQQQVGIPVAPVMQMPVQPAQPAQPPQPSQPSQPAGQPDPPKKTRRHRFGFRRTIRLIFLLAIVGCLAFGAVKYGPTVKAAIEKYGGITGALGHLITAGPTWKTETLYEYFNEKNEWVVYSYSKAGTDTVSRDYAVIGTVQTIQFDYVFSMEFKVDMSKAQFTREGEKLTVRLPSPYADNAILNVDENSIKSSGMFVFGNDKLTGYEEMREYKRTEYFDRYANDETVLDDAWNQTVNLLTDLAMQITGDPTIQVVAIRDDTLGK